MSTQPAGDYSIGSEKWPGLSKLAEEMGEVQQLLGKVIGAGGESAHWDGSDLRARLVEELADLSAAIYFFGVNNDLRTKEYFDRVNRKLKLFHKWHAEQKGGAK